MKKLLITAVPAFYEHVTGHVAEQIMQFIDDARRHPGADAVALHERAYGLYLGWRSFAMEMTSGERYLKDDQFLERIIVGPSHAFADLSLDEHRIIARAICVGPIKKAD